MGVLILYSAGAAIFYSNVNPEPDYDYSYRRIKRSMDDDSEPPNLLSILNSHWFQFILDAIEKLPDEKRRK